MGRISIKSLMMAVVVVAIGLASFANGWIWIECGIGPLVGALIGRARGRGIILGGMIGGLASMGGFCVLWFGWGFVMSGRFIPGPLHAALVTAAGSIAGLFLGWMVGSVLWLIDRAWARIRPTAD